MFCLDVDLSERKKIQAQLIQSERFTATCQLASTIAHEINSPLQAITYLLKTLKTKADQEE